MRYCLSVCLRVYDVQRWALRALNRQSVNATKYFNAIKFQSVEALLTLYCRTLVQDHKEVKAFKIRKRSCLGGRGTISNTES